MLLVSYNTIDSSLQHFYRAAQADSFNRAIVPVQKKPDVTTAQCVKEIYELFIWVLVISWYLLESWNWKYIMIVIKIIIYNTYIIYMPHMYFYYVYLISL